MNDDTNIPNNAWASSGRAKPRSRHPTRSNLPMAANTMFFNVQIPNPIAKPASK